MENNNRDRIIVKLEALLPWPPSTDPDVRFSPHPAPA